MKHAENLSKIFNTDLPEQKANLPAVAHSGDDDQEDDYQLARRTMRNIIQKSDGTLDDILELARSTEHPRAYEVAGQLIKTMSEVSKDLLALHAQRKDLKPIEEQPKIGQQNNIVFAGSTQDLLRMLQNNNKDEKTIDE